MARRLERTRFHWKNANLPVSVADDGDNDGSGDEPMAARPPRTPGDIARSQSTDSRRRQRGLLVGVPSSFILFSFSYFRPSHQLLKHRKDDVKKYFNGDLKERLFTMLTRLQGRGMNYPLTDDESSERMIQPCNHFWLAPEILSILRELDDVRKQARVQRLITRRGNRPIPQGMNIRVIADSSPTPSLPKNWYRQEWYNNLTQYQKLEISASSATEDLPNIVSHSGMIFVLSLLTLPPNSTTSMLLVKLYQQSVNRPDRIIARSFAVLAHVSPSLLRLRAASSWLPSSHVPLGDSRPFGPCWSPSFSQERSRHVFLPSFFPLS